MASDLPAADPVLGKSAYVLELQIPQPETARPLAIGHVEAEMNGLQQVELKQPGIIARLLGRKNKQNALLEIQNLLATQPLHDVEPGMIDGILAEYGLPPAQARHGLKNLFTTVLRYSVHDLNVSDKEVEDLQRLRTLFGLSDQDVREIESAVIHPIHRRELQKALADHHLTSEEKARLNDLVKRLRLPDEIAQAIYKEDATALTQRVFSKAVEDRRLSKEEEDQLAALADNLGVKITYDEASVATLERFRLLWRIEQGDLPDVPVPVHLQRGERCHVNIPASQYEFRAVTRAVRYSGPSYRLKITKGLSWRIGQVSVDRVTSEVLTLLDTGVLYITSKRLLFDGAKKNRAIPLQKIINFTVHKNGIQVEKDTGKDQFFQCAGDLELFGVILESAIRVSRK